MQITTIPLTGLYIGSFDPFTLGHLDIVNQVLGWSLTTYDAKTGKKEGDCPTYGKLIICVGKNDAKMPRFTVEERKKFIELAIAEHPRAKDISVIASDELTIDIARQNNVDYLIRGVRSETDMLAEKQLAETNRFLATQLGFELDTVFVEQKDKFLQIISSSLVRNLLKREKYAAAARCLPQPVAQKIIADELKPLFSRAVFDCCGSLDEMWNKIVEAYTPRPYHNFLHLAYMFDMLNIYLKHESIYFVELDQLNVAIILHDYVYKTHPSQSSPYQNEKDSAEIAKEWIKERGFSTSFISKMIMATTHDNAYVEKETLCSAEYTCCQLIADLDLCILGTADFKTYEAYTAGIRKEYAAYSDEEYKKGRLAFLFSLLKRKPLFHTKFFREMLEVQARRNIEREIKLLHLQP